MLTSKREKSISKFLALILRHAPEKIGIVPDRAGWVDVADLLHRSAAYGKAFTREELTEVVTNNAKQRFAFDDDGRRIRASQGHSITVDLGYTAAVPSTVLYHGTATKFMASIRKEGLVRGKRHHVHLSADRETAAQVGRRHGKLAILTVQAGRMHAAGSTFYRSENGVWLIAAVPLEYL